MSVKHVLSSDLPQVRTHAIQTPSREWKTLQSLSTIYYIRSSYHMMHEECLPFSGSSSSSSAAADTWAQSNSLVLNLTSAEHKQQEDKYVEWEKGRGTNWIRKEKKRSEELSMKGKEQFPLTISCQHCTQPHFTHHTSLTCLARAVWTEYRTLWN